jgi:hypothetical protein
MRFISDAVIFRACALAQSAAMALVLRASAASANAIFFFIDDSTTEFPIPVVVNPGGLEESHQNFFEETSGSFHLFGKYADKDTRVQRRQRWRPT